MVKNHLILAVTLLFTLVLSNPSQAQHQQVQTYYCESGNQMFSLHLQFISEQIFGNLHCKSLSDFSATTYRIEGNLLADGQIVLLDQLSKNEIFRGQLTNKGFAGQLKFDSENIQKVEFLQSSDSEMIPIRIFSIAEQQMLRAADPASPSALVELQVLFPANPDVAIQTSLNDFFRFGKSREAVEVLLKQQTNQFFSQYRELANIPSASGPSFQWIKQLETTQMFNRLGILCLKKTTYVFTGGAHGMEHHEFGIFDINGKKLEINDIFTENVKDVLTEMITEKIKSDKGLLKNDVLSEHGYFIDLIEPNSNLFICDAGIGFYYNSYEIAPYSSGHTLVLLHFDAIKHLLKLTATINY